MKLHNPKHTHLLNIKTYDEQLKLMLTKRNHFLNFKKIKWFFDFIKWIWQVCIAGATLTYTNQKSPNLTYNNH